MVVNVAGCTLFVLKLKAKSHKKLQKIQSISIGVLLDSDWAEGVD